MTAMRPPSGPDAAFPGVAAGEALLGVHGIRPGADRDFILRVRIPAGRLTAAQYLALDDLADRHGDGTLHLTPRQEVELHGILKRDLKEAIGAIHLARLTTLGAGGNVARGVTAAAARRDGPYRRLEEDAQRLSDHLLPRTEAYDELWLDGAPASGAGEDALYGAAALPHALEIGLALPQDDAVDVLSNDVAFIARHEGERLLGYTLALGRQPSRAAAPIAFIEPHDLLAAGAAVVRLFRDHGARDERSRALGQLIAERDAGWAKAQLEAGLGKTLAAPLPLPPFHVADHLGWREQGDGWLSLGIAVPGGRIAAGERRRAALRLLCKSFAGSVLLLPQQIVLGTIAPADRLAAAAALGRLGVAIAAGGDAPVALQEAS